MTLPQTRKLLVGLLALAVVWSILPAAAHATFLGSNGKLAFGSARNGFPADNDLFTMANDGTVQTRITSLNQDELNPSWSAKGNKIVFERTAGLRSDIWSANADGSNAVQLTNDPRTDLRPSWNNTGKKIVFASDRDGTEGIFDLYVMDSTGANEVNVTNTPNISEEYPSWSPDGSAIAFSRDGDIYKFTAVGAQMGTNLKRLTTDPIFEMEPDWNPTSSWIVYSTGINGDQEIRKTQANGISGGSGYFPLTTNGSIPEDHPTWSPDGSKVAFIRGAFKDAEVYTMNQDGTNVVRITNNTLLDSAPAWQPIPLPVTFVRPKTANPVRFPLVPAFRPCKTANRTHGPPQVQPSCNPPKPYSRYLTIGSPDANGAAANFNGLVKLQVIAGDPGTPADEADVRIVIQVDDVRNKADLTDYTGQLRVRAEYRRQTDKENAVGAGSPTEAATSMDSPLSFTVPCIATASTSIGSNCDLSTTRDAITPGAVKESKRTVLALGRMQVFDGGADGQSSTQVNDLFLTQGFYVP